MTERAAHAVDAVLPRVPVRQWVLSLPHWLRYLLAWDHGLCRAVLGVDVLLCPGCGGRLRLIATILDPRTIRAMLLSLGLPTEAADRSPPDAHRG